ncbi:hypothetical protein AeMF1_001501 [Aphanomyces euteiches]|nr:hypothetical protein AeMF1_001501 [Aphanomyces euteiches]
MPSGINLTDAILGPLADLCASEELKTCLVVADDGCVEALRWSGGLAFLLESVQVQSVMSWHQVVTAVCSPPKQSFDLETTTIAHLFDPWMTGKKHKVLLLTSRPFAEMEPVLAALIREDVASQFVVATAIPEKAHALTFDTARTRLLRNTSGNDHQVRIVYLPLLYAPLLDAKAETHPSLFVLTHPECAPVFPLMRSQLKQSEEHAWKHVRDVAPQDIPERSRKAFKCLAQVLGGMIMQWQVEVKDRIFALGATSLKVGHTLQHFLDQLQEECTMTELKELKPATLILVDRTCDLATPSSHQYTLLDRILQQLPPATTTDPATSKADHITEVSPLYSTPSPTPFGAASAIPPECTPSSFLSAVTWAGGVSICHARAGTASNRVFESLATMAPIAALKHLDKELKEVAMDLLKQKLTPVPEKKNQPRGRDVILRWIKCISDCVDAKITWQHQELLQIGIAVLETLERMESSDMAWKQLVGVEKDFASRNEYPEWIVPGLVEWLAGQNAYESSVDLALAFQLCIYAFALSGDRPMEPHTKKTFIDAIKTTILQSVPHRLVPREIERSGGSDSDVVVVNEKAGQDDDWDDWEEEEGETSSSPSQNEPNSSLSQSTQQALDEFVAKIFPTLEECGQLYFELPGSPETTGLLPRLISLLTDESHPSIPHLQHVTDASEQLTKAGMDLLKSGLSVFGFGGQETMLHAAAATKTAHCKPNEATIVFVIGGMTLHEMQSISQVLQTRRPDLHVVVGSTTITNPEKIRAHLFG